MTDARLTEVKRGRNLKAYCDTHLQRCGGTYVCPACGSGNGQKHTPAFTLNVTKGIWHCFSCGSGGDLLDLIGIVEGVEGYKAQLDRACQFLGIQVEGSGANKGLASHGTTKNSSLPTGTHEPGMGEGNRPTAATVRDSRPARGEVPPHRQGTPDDHADQYQAGRRAEEERLSGWLDAFEQSDEAKDYVRTRGLASYGYRFGWDAKRRRLVIPWPGQSSPWYHIDRDVTGSSSHKYEKPRTDVVGPQPIFSIGWSREAGGTVVIVEGAFDAMAVHAIGFPRVIALCGSSSNAVIRCLMGYRDGVIVALDNDDTGREQGRRMMDALHAQGVAAVVLEWSGISGKDADEAFQAGDSNRALLLQALSGAADAVETEVRTAAAASPADDEVPSETLVDPSEVLQALRDGNGSGSPIPTGLASLDGILAGGLRRGLYVLGASSSFGKTTVSLQVADHIAAQGHPVLFVTVEQSAGELVAKSVSRLSRGVGGDAGVGISAYDVFTGCHASTLDASVSFYGATVAPFLRFMESRSRPTVAAVRAAADGLCRHFGRSPVVFVDYLQLLAPQDPHMSDKQALDMNVTGLRQLARDMDTPVWCVASINRSSYAGPVELDSFKESGGVEYGADVLMGLQPVGISEAVRRVRAAAERQLAGERMVEESKRSDPRHVELTILKNRNGIVTGSSKGLAFDYYPRTNIFVDLGTA